jgi:hypothetical protein
MGETPSEPTAVGSGSGKGQTSSGVDMLVLQITVLCLDQAGSDPWVGSSPVQESSLELLELRNNPIV